MIEDSSMLELKILLFLLAVVVVTYFTWKEIETIKQRLDVLEKEKTGS